MGRCHDVSLRPVASPSAPHEPLAMATKPVGKRFDKYRDRRQILSHREMILPRNDGRSVISVPGAIYEDPHSIGLREEVTDVAGVVVDQYVRAVHTLPLLSRADDRVKLEARVL